MAEIHVGISGWTYPPWRGDFYPPGLPHKRELSYAASKLGSIEVNGTFYGLLRPTSFASWVSEVPADFVFAVKGSRFITHLKKLADVRTPLANFFASGVLALEEHLGPLLWQLPPNLGYDRERLAAFFELLPGPSARRPRSLVSTISGSPRTGSCSPLPIRSTRSGMPSRSGTTVSGPRN